MHRCRLWVRRPGSWVAASALLPLSMAPVQAESWISAPVELRLGYETLRLPDETRMGLVGTSHLVELRPGLCAGPAVHGAVSGERGWTRAPPGSFSAVRIAGAALGPRPGRRRAGAHRRADAGGRRNA